MGEIIRWRRRRLPSAGFRAPACLHEFSTEKNAHDPNKIQVKLEQKKKAFIETGSELDFELWNSLKGKRRLQWIIGNEKRRKKTRNHKFKRPGDWQSETHKAQLSPSLSHPSVPIFKSSLYTKRHGQKIE